MALDKTAVWFCRSKATPFKISKNMVARVHKSISATRNRILQVKSKENLQTLCIIFNVHNVQSIHVSDKFLSNMILAIGEFPRKHLNFVCSPYKLPLFELCHSSEIGPLARWIGNVHNSEETYCLKF